MNKTFSIIGGDSRIIRLAQMLKDDGNNIKTFGIEKTQKIIESDKQKYIEDALENADIVISAIPFSKDGMYVNAPFAENRILLDEFLSKIKNQKLFLGSINKNIRSIYSRIKIYDFMDYEDLTIMNAVSTAEGAIEIAMKETEITIHNSNVLVLGFGRIGKILAKDLKALGAKITCEARKDSDLAWINAYGYRSLKLENLEEKLGEYEIIFNTVPNLILDYKKIKNIQENCLIIDLASKPGGVDFEECNKNGIKAILALGIPGKVAPKTSAQYLKEIIYQTIEKE